MSTEVPFTPLTPDDLARLEPAERMAFTVAAGQVARDVNPGINTTAALLLTIQRLIGEALERAEGHGAGTAPDGTPGVSAAAPGRTGPHADPSSSGEAIAYAALDRAVERMRTAEGRLLDAQNAIGQVLRKAGSWQMEGGQFADVARWLLDALGPWTGRTRSEEGKREPARPHVTVDLNVRVRKHETYSGFGDVTGADPAALRWGDRVLAVEAESRICAEAIVTGLDAEKRLVYLVPDWHGWRDLEGSAEEAGRG
jgi:hypothetical protein